jgi:hypothetical protein
MTMKSKPNGHAGAISCRGLDRAASDDVSELPVANAAASSAAAGTERETSADVAQAEGEGKQPKTPKAASRARNGRNHRNGSDESGAAQPAPEEASATKRVRDVVPGLEPLPIDGEAFVDAVHAEVDLVRLEVGLLSSEDEKIVQRELAYLRELRYGKRAPASEDDGSAASIFDAPRPERDLT